MRPFTAQSLKEDDRFYVSLGSNIWIVDNHKWAFYIWEEMARDTAVKNYCLVHVDYHWDGGNEFFGHPNKEKELLEAGIEVIHSLIEEGRWVTFDSFISPAIIRGLVKEVHFFCTQDDGSDRAIDDELLERTGVTQMIHPSMESLSCIEPELPLIFDFCLDIFNESDQWYEGDIWVDEDIELLLLACKPLVIKADIVTVSLSFGYSGTEDDTRRLAEIVVPHFQEWRNDS